MCRLGDHAIKDFFQGIDSVASGGVFRVHEMHGIVFVAMASLSQYFERVGV